MLEILLETVKMAVPKIKRKQLTFYIRAQTLMEVIS